MFFPDHAAGEIIKMALKEDLGHGDLTTIYLIDPSKKAKANIWAKEDGVIAGLPAAKKVFDIIGDIEFTYQVIDGAKVKKGTSLATLYGNTAGLLNGERVALNFLQRLSGIATKTKELVDKVDAYRVKLADTRKTTPLLRVLERYAVRVGGGFNHRFGLADAILIKDNHIHAVGGIEKAVALARQKSGHTVKIEVEVEDLRGVEKALAAGADIILLDNMTTDTMAEAVKLIAGRAITEASGGITEENIAATAATGVDVISLGMLTHSVKSLDISMDFY